MDRRLPTGHRVPSYSPSLCSFPVHALLARIANCSCSYSRRSHRSGNARTWKMQSSKWVHTLSPYPKQACDPDRIVIDDGLWSDLRSSIRLATPTETKVPTNHSNYYSTVAGSPPRIPHASQAAASRRLTIKPSSRLRPSLRTCTAHLCDYPPINSISRWREWMLPVHARCPTEVQGGTINQTA
jgi:hypothetical protein